MSIVTDTKYLVHTSCLKHIDYINFLSVLLMSMRVSATHWFWYSFGDWCIRFYERLCPKSIEMSDMGHGTCESLRINRSDVNREWSNPNFIIQIGDEPRIYRLIVAVVNHMVNGTYLSSGLSSTKWVEQSD